MTTTEKIPGLLATDSTIAQQYSDTFRRNEHLEPEKALLLAMLEDTIHCFQQYSTAKDRAGRERFREAENWITGDRGDWIFSFDNVCDLLNLDPRHIRHGLLALRDKDLKAHKRRKGGRLRGQAA